MASDEFCHTSKQETQDASLPMRTNDDQIGAPLLRAIDDALSDVTCLDCSVGLEPGALQLFRNSLDQCVSWHFLALQLGRVAWVHLRGADATGSSTCRTRISVFSVRNRLTIACNISPANFDSSTPTKILMILLPLRCNRIDTANDRIPVGGLSVRYGDSRNTLSHGRRQYGCHCRSVVEPGPDSDRGTGSCCHLWNPFSSIGFRCLSRTTVRSHAVLFLRLHLSTGRSSSAARNCANRSRNQSLCHTP